MAVWSCVTAMRIRRNMNPSPYVLNRMYSQPAERQEPVKALQSKERTMNSEYFMTCYGNRQRTINRLCR